MDLLSGVTQNKKFVRTNRKRKSKKLTRVSFIDKKTRGIITAKRYFTNDIINETTQRFNDRIIDYFFSKFQTAKQLFIKHRVVEIETSNRHILLTFDHNLSIGIYLKHDLTRKIIIFDADDNIVEERVLAYSENDNTNEEFAELLG